MKRKSLGETLRHYRGVSSLTQEELSFESGVSYRFVQEIEADKQQPTMTTVFKLCVALKITPDKLIMPAWERWRENPEG